MSGIRWFEEISAGEIDLVGGKGANLGEMARAGFPVPPGFCVIAPAYRQMVEESGLYPKIESILAQMDIDDQAGVADKAAQIRDLIVNQPVPAALAEEITAGYRELGERLALADPLSAPVAVRSSATAEDLPTASFAGQQDTYLNVRGPEALLDHIRRCWASLWTDRAVSYRTKQGFDHQKVYVSVVVQAMINSEVSGILFTVNAVNYDPEEVVINASWGLGEAIVGGDVNPDTLIVRKEDGRVVSRQTASKDLMIIYAADGGTITIDTPEELRLPPCLTDSQAAELATLGARIEAHYDRPMDIEWGLLNDELYLLQARPITTLAPPEKVHDVEGEYSRVMMVEIFPDALSPAFLSVVEPLLKRMFDYTFWRLGFKTPEGIEAIGTFYHQPYFHRRYLEEAFSRLSPAVRKSMVEQFINPISHEEEESSHELSFAYLNMLVRMLRFMVLFPKRLPGIIDRYHAEIDEANAFDVDRATDEEIVTRIRGLVFETISRLMNYDFLLIAMTGRTYELLEGVLAPHYGQETEAAVAKLISGLSGNATMETNMQLWDLAQEAKRSDEVSQVIRTGDAHQALAQLRESAAGRTFLERLDHFMHGYGHREIRLDIIYPTWKEDPTPVFSFLRSYLDAEERQSPYAQQERLEQERLELTGQAEARVARGLRGRLIRRPLFRWLLGQAQMCTRERDTMHFEWTRLFPPARRMILAMGRRWCDRGLLAEADDIFYMRFAEMESMVTAPTSFKEIVQDRKEAFEAARSYPWPDIIRDGQEIYLERGDGAPSSDDYLNGVAGSPGVVSGAARVVAGPEDFHKLGKGEILVAPLTNPVWTPLFAVAGGLVTEVGGILSHGAIVAREYGIPAVMSVNGATGKISDGQTVTIDGNKGIVYVEG
jgi:pyruvate,water dikinase